ncbi:MAG: HlyD family efflux transporter periplasmic adaptor subunit [Planctomycetales bacterium]|nr:HlyD family efflux transporter periplasmic adaptor subunit [Planctomycetales bacterium]
MSSSIFTFSRTIYTSLCGVCAAFLICLPRANGQSLPQSGYLLENIRPSPSEQLSQDLSAGQQIVVENAILKTIEATVIPAQVSGTLESLAVAEGSVVKIGQRVGKINDKALSLQVEYKRIARSAAEKKYGSQIDLNLAIKKKEVASLELERAEEANSRIANTYPPKEIDRLNLVAHSASLEVERARLEQELLEYEVLLASTELKQVEELLSRHEIISPAEGVVVSIGRRVGEWVEPGAELVTVVNTNRLRIEGFITSAEITSDLVGQSANVTLLRGSQTFEITGKVVFVSPDANPVNGQVRVYLEIDNSQAQFRPGLRVKAMILVKP